ncbi:hypothetical protein AB0B06_37400 [Streptomyces sp. NPDC044989]|uniref:hypothetical protein n=1 Tax=Streptomyces sp. NPDC044989 TaxID=3154336 RepID=UPI0033C7F584
MQDREEHNGEGWSPSDERLPAQGGENGKAQGQGGSKDDTTSGESRRNGGSLPSSQTEGDHCGDSGEQNGYRQDEKQERYGAVFHEGTTLMRFARKGLRRF